MKFMDKFTEGAQKALIYSQEAAKALGHNYVGTEHLLLGLIREKTGAAANMLAQMNVGEQNVTDAIDKLIGRGDFAFNEAFDYTPRTKKVIEGSMEAARNLGHNFVGTEHLLLSLIREKEGIAFRILTEMGADPLKIQDALLGGSSDKAFPSDSKDKSTTPALDQFGRDLTGAAKNGELDPVIGRAEEIDRILQILSRRTKNNPVLIGEPGVGKSAVVEGLAQRIVEGRIPELLKNKRIVSLDLAGMLAGAKYRGEFEERLKNAMSELKKSGDTILFIDELHNLVGAGAAEGAIDAANILKPALARGEIQTIGATTLDEYRKHVEKDAALERRFQPVMVGEPSVEETIGILNGLKDKYEAHHKVRIEEEAIKAAATLSERYITDRFLPDKAIDLMDEAASRVRLRSFTAPPDIKELEVKLEAQSKEKAEAIAHQNFEKAAQIRDTEQKLKKEIAHIKQVWEKQQQATPQIVTEEDIAQIVSSWMSIPVKKLTEDESQRLLRLEETLHQRVVGQDEAVSAVSRAIRRARAGLKDPKRPIGSFIFLGPTGVGKTELSKALAEAMFADENAMVRIDMSEYMEKHSVARIIGSPPGYVGYEEGGQLTEKIRRKPYSVILFDEIEKAHPDVFNVLLQIMEDGRLTDGKGRMVDFKNAILIMTSNVGAQTIRSQSIGFGSTHRDNMTFEKMKENLLEELKKTFRPEFLNRVDDVIVFHALSEEHTRKIVDLMLESVAKRLIDREIYLSVLPEARDFLAEKGFDPIYGARPLRRAIQQMIEDNLSEEILAGRIAIGDKVEAYMDGDKLTFRKTV
jgi:ATP-dependent Clp protease ATP-binding subunit ClpC